MKKLIVVHPMSELYLSGKKGLILMSQPSNDNDLIKMGTLFIACDFETFQTTGWLISRKQVKKKNLTAEN